MEPIGPGTAAYFPSILSRIREACPDLPLEPVIVQSILLCLVAGDDDATPQIASHGSRNLILRTREEDVGLVLALTELVSLYCICIIIYAQNSAAWGVCTRYLPCHGRVYRLTCAYSHSYARGTICGSLLAR